MKIYLKIVALLIYLIISFGFVLPFLFSACSTELVIGGIIYIISMPIIIFFVLKSIKNNLNLKQNEKTN